jgi:MOSC domain-containing protein YiiM
MSLTSSRSSGNCRQARVVKHIFIAEARGEPMKSVRSADAVMEQGLVGDRYCKGSARRGPDYQVSLIEAEAIEEFTKELGLTMSADMPRRNIVTMGIRLNELLGKRFFVGDVVLEGLELCEPCSLFAKRTYPQVLPFFKGRGGLRARIVGGGAVRVGDRIAVAPDE